VSTDKNATNIKTCFATQKPKDIIWSLKLANMGNDYTNLPEEIKKMIVIVEDFIKVKNLICYGGTAINNILPLEDQFYDKDVEIPDYDFFTPDALSDAKELANYGLKKGSQDNITVIVYFFN
jgi:hypothetical protein